MNIKSIYNINLNGKSSLKSLDMAFTNRLCACSFFFILLPVVYINLFVFQQCLGSTPEVPEMRCCLVYSQISRAALT